MTSGGRPDRGSADDRRSGSAEDRRSGSAEDRPDLAQSALLDAVMAIADGLDLDGTLHRIVTAAVDLVEARYGALGIVGPDGRVSRFVHVGVDDEVARRIGPLPEGRGILGLLTADPRPIRLADLNDHPQAAGFPANHPPMKTFLGVPIRVRGRVFGNLYLTEKRHGSFDGRDEDLLVALGAAAGVAIQNARLFDRSRIRQRWQRGVAAIDALVLADASEEQLLAETARRARGLAGAAVATLVLPDADDQLVVSAVAVMAAEGVGTHQWSVAHSRVPVGALAVLAAVGEANGASVDPADPAAQAYLSAATVRAEESAPIVPGGDSPGTPIRVFGPTLALPLKARERVLGALLLQRLIGDVPFDDEDVDLAESFAGQTAVALSFTRERRERERLAVFEERDRIARDLHDLVIQRLFATGMMLEGATRLAELPPVLAERIRVAVDELDGTVKEIRTSIFELHDVTEEPSWVGVRARVLAEVERARLGHRPRPSVRFVGAVDSTVEPAVVGHLVAAVREGLSNALRHADCRRVEVEVAVADGRLSMSVLDDGIGLPDEGMPRLSGLANLDRRAAEMGGRCVLGPRPGGGAELRWWVELD